MFGRMKKQELERIDSGYAMTLTEAIRKAQDLGKKLRSGELSKEEHDMLLTNLRARARKKNDG